MVVAGHVLQELAHKVRAFRPGADHAHVTLQNVDELRQFIETCLSQEYAEPGSPGVILRGPARVPFFTISLGHMHGPEFVHLERLPIEPDAFLNEKYRTTRSEPNQQGGQNH